MTTRPARLGPGGDGPRAVGTGRRGRDPATARDVACVAVVVAGAGVVVLGDLPDGATGGTWRRAALTLCVALALCWRRRRPLRVLLFASAAVACGASASALPVALVTVAVRRRDRVLALGAAVAQVCLLAGAWQQFQPDGLAGRALSATAYGAVFVGVPVAAGAYVGIRRELLASLQERAERAEAERVAEAGRARSAERNRIAQEMHDVLGHRISLLALHAGGLEVNPGLGPEAVARSAALIRTTARQALDDLRGVVGVLRSDVPATVVPQPGLPEVRHLVGDTTAAGVAVGLCDELPTDCPVPPLLGRTVFRVVQEGLTNAVKHSPGAPVAISLAGGPGTGLRIEVRNERAPHAVAQAHASGSGLGLVGLRERVTLAGGFLRAGRQEDGGFGLLAVVPWPVEGKPPPDAEDGA